LDILGADGYLWHDESAPLGGELAGGYMQAGHIKVAAAGVDIARDIIAKRYLKLPLK
jgi:hypothetical protein